MQAITSSVIAPILKWQGGKHSTPVAERVAQLVAPCLATHLWIEPFVGAGGMLLHQQPQRALLCDVNPELAGLHRWLKEGGVYVHPFEPVDELTADIYYQQRLRYNGLLSEYRASPDLVDHDQFFSLLIWLNKAGFNGLYRLNGNGEFNVPVGKNSQGVMRNPDHEALAHRVQCMSSFYQRHGWEFTCGDFSHLSTWKVFAETQQKIVYCDPPYHGTFDQYSPQRFTWTDQKRLAEWLDGLNCPVIASNADHADIRTLYGSLGFTIEEIMVRRSGSASASGRGVVKELLVCKGLEVC